MFSVNLRGSVKLYGDSRQTPRDVGMKLCLVYVTLTSGLVKSLLQTPFQQVSHSAQW